MCAAKTISQSTEAAYPFSDASSYRVDPRTESAYAVRGPVSFRLAVHGLAANAVVNEAVTLHGFRLEEVAAIEDDTLAEQAAHDLEIWITKLLPFGDDGQPVRAFQR